MERCLHITDGVCRHLLFHMLRRYAAEKISVFVLFYE